MVVKEFDYVNGNTAIKPERRSTESDRRKYEELKRSKRQINKRKFEEAKRKRRGVLQIAAFIFILGIIVIYRDNMVYSMQRDVSKINQDIKTVKDQNEALKVELLKGSSLDNIKSKAESKLGMVIATKDNTVQVELPSKYFNYIESIEKKDNK